MDNIVSFLRATGEPSRLRLLFLLSRGDLTVTELTQILGQSQPRISRHLKILVDAGLIERVPEGTWAFFRMPGAAGNSWDSGEKRPQTDIIMRAILDAIDVDDPDVKRDLSRLAQIEEDRNKTASAYFSANADEWDTIRALHLPETQVEHALVEMFQGRQFSDYVDLGTGTGRLLELISPYTDHGIGFDTNREMLNVARSNLAAAGVENCRVQQGDILSLTLPDECADLVTIHQVLHYLSDPSAAVAEAARLLRPGGILIIVDFKPHDLDFLRSEFAHLRLGFADQDVREWTAKAGLQIEEVKDLPPKSQEADKKLTVGIWKAIDPRIVVAGPSTQAAQ